MTPDVPVPDLPVIETTLLRGRVRLLQPKVGFHASIDTVFLAAAVPAKDRWQVLDVGCGVGSAGICVTSRKSNIYLTGIDIQRDLVDLALQNAVLNDASARARFFQGSLLDEKIIENNYFNSVLMNPPYQESGTHTPSPKTIKAFSHGEDASGATLENWVKYSHSKLKNGGYLTMVHRADRLDDVLIALGKKRWFGSFVVYPLYSYAGDDARRVIVQARKERYAALKLKSGMVIHQKNGKYTLEAEAVLSDGAEIDMS